jgi:putative hydrolase of the HAD superfamily
MRFSTLFFDLDDTLYPSECGLWGEIRSRIQRFLLEKLQLTTEEATALSRQYYERYGTTLRGLQRHHAVDTDEFLRFVHDLPLASYLSPDPKLKTMLASLHQDKWIFTNADEAHAQRVLSALDLEGIFNGIIDVRSLDFDCKPHPSAYLMAMKIAGERDPANCVFLDDSLRNLAPAHELGFFTVLVGKKEAGPGASLTIPDLLHLPEAMPELFRSPDQISP